MKKLAIIIPCYDEPAERIVLSALGAVHAQQSYPDMIGGLFLAAGSKSSDDLYSTKQAQIALSQLNSMDAQVLIVPYGKGNAMIAAAKKVANLLYTYAIFMDADLIGVNKLHIKQLLNSFEKNPSASIRAVISGTNKKLGQILTQRILGKDITGQRIIQLDQLIEIGELATEPIHYSIERILNLYAYKYRIQIISEVWQNTSQVDKHEKSKNKILGAIKSFLTMHIEIFQSGKKWKKILGIK